MISVFSEMPQLLLFMLWFFLCRKSNTTWHCDLIFSARKQTLWAFHQDAFKLIWNVLLNQGASGMLPACKGILICFYWCKVEERFCSTQHSTFKILLHWCVCWLWLCVWFVCVCICVIFFINLNTPEAFEETSNNEL